MRTIHTTDEDFDTHVKEIIGDFLEQNKEDAAEAKENGTSLDDYLWKNREEIGGLFIQNLQQWTDVEEICGEQWNELESEADEE
jgi:hypothetical protein